MSKGDLKIKKLQDNIKIKNEVEKNLFNVKTKELDIRSKLIESQLLSRCSHLHKNSPCSTKILLEYGVHPT